MSSKQIKKRSTKGESFCYCLEIRFIYWVTFLVLPSSQYSITKPLKPSSTSCPTELIFLSKILFLELLIEMILFERIVQSKSTYFNR